MTPLLRFVLFQTVAVWCGVLLSTGIAYAGPALTSIDTAAMGSGQVRLRLHLSGPAPAPSVFTVDNPARLSIDLPDTTLGLDQRYQRIGEGPVEAVTAAAGNDKTRVVIELTQMTAYDIQRRANEMVVTIGGSRTGQRAPAAQPGASGSSATARHGPARTIRNIDFRRGSQGTGRIAVSLDGSNAPVDISRANGQIVARLPGIELPSRLKKRLDVTDFATPVQTIDALSSGGDTRLVITPEPNIPFQRLAYQTGNQLYIELQPLSETEKQQQQQTHPQYDGKQISLSFQNIPIRSVLQIIADVANVNMVVSDSVSGTIALQLEDVPWDQALDIILDAKGLGMTHSNNVITVAPLTEIASREQAKAKARAASQELAPLHSEIIQINYANAADIANILQSDSRTTTKTFTPSPNSDRTSGYVDAALSQIATANQRSSSVISNSDVDQHSLLSPRGHVTVDDRTNSLLLTDTQGKIDQVRDLINRLDIPVRQVLIESRIVVANRDFSRNLGVSQTGVDNSNLNNALSDDFNYNANNRGYAVSLPATDATSVLSTSIISDTFSLNLELSAMESENNGEIISSPRIITADGQEANIEQGREIPYQSGSEGSDQGTSVEFKKAVLGLNVTPKITPNKKVIMNLNVTQDSVGEYVPTSEGGSVPSIDTRSLTTQVLVDNGDTVVLGGIFEQTNRDETDGVPFIRKIPLLGALFKSHSRQRDKQELLIFVTPKILDSNLAIGRR
ncbi:type IV pilus secretin PilQ [Salinisphaera sp. SPP-AMP-43]|uniref:type IV pilus secretin PilQ n=1 Tax=Salinisphaera sp. SPP-AMP-43 TaxID=3121288 RepID=UPI003C6DCAB9